jgi:hypothetical protein
MFDAPRTSTSRARAAFTPMVLESVVFLSGGGRHAASLGVPSLLALMTKTAAKGAQREHALQRTALAVAPHDRRVCRVVCAQVAHRRLQPAGERAGRCHRRRCPHGLHPSQRSRGAHDHAIDEGTRPCMCFRRRLGLCMTRALRALRKMRDAAAKPRCVPVCDSHDHDREAV